MYFLMSNSDFFSLDQQSIFHNNGHPVTQPCSNLFCVSIIAKISSSQLPGCYTSSCGVSSYNNISTSQVPPRGVSRALVCVLHKPAARVYSNDPSDKSPRQFFRGLRFVLPIITFLLFAAVRWFNRWPVVANQSLWVICTNTTKILDIILEVVIDWLLNDRILLVLFLMMLLIFHFVPPIVTRLTGFIQFSVFV